MASKCHKLWSFRPFRLIPPLKSWLGVDWMGRLVCFRFFLASIVCQRSVDFAGVTSVLFQRGCVRGGRQRVVFGSNGGHVPSCADVISRSSCVCVCVVNPITFRSKLLYASRRLCHTIEAVVSTAPCTRLRYDAARCGRAIGGHRISVWFRVALVPSKYTRHHRMVSPLFSFPVWRVCLTLLCGFP